MFKRELTFDEELDEFIVKATEWVSGWIETQSVVTHQSLIHYTVSYYPSITTTNCKAILEKLAGMNCLRPLVETQRRRVHSTQICSRCTLCPKSVHTISTLFHPNKLIIFIYSSTCIQ